MKILFDEHLTKPSVFHEKDGRKYKHPSTTDAKDARQKAKELKNPSLQFKMNRKLSMSKQQ